MLSCPSSCQSFPQKIQILTCSVLVQVLLSNLSGHHPLVVVVVAAEVAVVVAPFDAEVVLSAFALPVSVAVVVLVVVSPSDAEVVVYVALPVVAFASSSVVVALDFQAATGFALLIRYVRIAFWGVELLMLLLVQAFLSPERRVWA